MEAEYLTVTDASKYLRISRDSFYLYVSPEVDRYKIGSMYRYKKSDLDRYMMSKKDE
jgi:excisionase family DNA binding protein